MVLQRMGLSRMKAGGEKRGPGTIALWAGGFLLVNLAPIANFAAVGELGSALTGAFVGTNVAFTALLAIPFLGERLTAFRAVVSACLLSAIAASPFLAAASEPPTVGHATLPALAAGFALPLAAALFALLGLRRASNPGLSGAILGAASGAFGGLAIVAMEAARLVDGLDLGAYLTHYPIYAYALAAAFAIAAMQFACARSPLAAVSGPLYGAQVLYPSLVGAFAFARVPGAWHIAAMLAIAACALLLAGSAKDAGKA
jgi:hypothetical protein